MPATIWLGKYTSLPQTIIAYGISFGGLLTIAVSVSVSNGTVLGNNEEQRIRKETIVVSWRIKVGTNL